MNGLFAINKPSGISSAQLLNNLKRVLSKSALFPEEPQPNGGHKRNWKRNRNAGVKLGHGGTLDPLASGVLVVGVGKGTKQLQKFLHCTKEYEATALFGIATDTYDSEGVILRKAPFEHITLQGVTTALDQFRGETDQQPPLYSALRMDGKRLYDYARQGMPLPKDIPSRKVTISELLLVSFEKQHAYIEPMEAPAELLAGIPEPSKGAEVKQATSSSNPDKTEPAKLKKSDSAPPAKGATKDSTKYTPPVNTNTTPSAAPIIIIRTTVSSGTYIRSLVHDIGLAVGSAAHMVKLVRTRQGEFALADAIDWSLFESGDWEALLQQRIKKV